MMTEPKSYPCCDNPRCPFCWGTGTHEDLAAEIADHEASLSEYDARVLIGSGAALPVLPPKGEPCARCGGPNASREGTGILLCDDCIPVVLPFRDPDAEPPF